MPAGPEPMTATRLPDAGWTSNGTGAFCAERLRLEHLVARVPVAVADGDGLLDLVPPAVLLAGRRAHPAEHARERDGPLEDARRLGEGALGVRLEEARDVDVAGALVLAGRQAVRVVVAEDELEVGLADLAQPGRLGRTTISGSAFAGAADGRGVLTLDLDHAHPARPEPGQLGLVAQRGHLDAVVAADLEDGLAFAPREGRGRRSRWMKRGRDLRSLRALRREQPFRDRVDGVVPELAGRCRSSVEAIPGVRRGLRLGRWSSVCHRGDPDGLADAGGAGAPHDVVLELLREVSHPGHAAG